MIDSDSTSMLHHQIQMDLNEAKIRSLKIRRWLKTDEVALYLGSTREAIKKAYQRGKLKANKFSGRLYFDREMLDLLIEESAIGFIPLKPQSGMQIPNPRRKIQWR